MPMCAVLIMSALTQHRDYSRKKATRQREQTAVVVIVVIIVIVLRTLRSLALFLLMWLAAKLRCRHDHMIVVIVMPTANHLDFTDTRHARAHAL